MKETVAFPMEGGGSIQIEVEDAPFTAVELHSAGAGREQILRFKTNLDDWADCDAGHPLRVVTAENGEPRPYLLLRDRLEALILRPVFYELVELAVEGDGADGWRRHRVDQTPVHPVQ